MMNNLAPTDSKDAAWASVKTPLESKTLIEFCQDATRLLRINPYLEFESWESSGENCYRIQGRNLSSVPALNIDLELEAIPQSDGLRLNYRQGLKASTYFKVEAVDQGSLLTIIEDYSSLPKHEREARIHEVDKSLVKWAEDLQAYLVRWKRWSRFAPWRWYMQWVWQPMKPSARRITYMLLWISAIEVTLIALGVAIYFVEYS